MMRFEFLANHKEAIPVLANWYFKEWGYQEEGNTLAQETKLVYDYLNTDKIPLVVLAIEEDEFLGAAQLKYREMNIYPEKEHWLGGVYVAEKHRGKEVARQIINKVVSVAVQLGVQKLYLQTVNLEGGLYRILGWKPIEQVNYNGIDVLVMERDLVP